MEKRKKIICVALVFVLVFASLGTVLVLHKGSAVEKTESTINLQIFGNANEDDEIDESDINFIHDIIDGKRVASNYSDANCDGNIDQSDIDQVEAIIHHTESKIFYLNVDGNNCSVDFPVKSMIVNYNLYAEIVYILNATNIVVGIDDTIVKYKSVYSDIANLPSVGSRNSPNEGRLAMSE
jgi:iron complex transport system substrate-binding protein